jgi:Gas vesicle synthesis protein GvpL/GvpF
MRPTRDTATYLYCLVAADRRPSLAGAPRGLPGTGPLRALEAADGLWLIVADAPRTAYGSEPIERGLRDLEWVALRGAAHARVIEYFARRVTTLPMKLFTLFNSEARALAHVRGEAGRIRRVLTRVNGREEWGVRIRLDPALVRKLTARRPAAAVNGGSAGTKFLLAKKQARDVAQEILREGRAAVEEAWEALAALADATRRRPAGELEGTRVVLDGALLVPAGRLVSFKRLVRRTASELTARGYRLSLTGPWPAYNFVGDGR